MIFRDSVSENKQTNKSSRNRNTRMINHFCSPWNDVLLAVAISHFSSKHNTGRQSHTNSMHMFQIPVCCHEVIC